MMTRREGRWYWRHKDKAGVVHFFEHNAWRGTANLLCNGSTIIQPNHRGPETRVNCLRCIGLHQKDNAHVAALKEAEDAY